MPLAGARALGTLVVVSVVASVPLGAQGLPDLPLDTYPPASREPIARALAEARARPGDADASGRLAMLLHAWEQWETATRVYARARALEHRFDWFYLGGIVEARLAHPVEAAALFREAVAITPTYLPARLNLADALLDAGDLEGAERAFMALSTEPQAEPHARYGLGRVYAARGNHERAVAEFERAVRVYPEFAAAWYSRGLSLRNLGRLDDARESLGRAREFGTRFPGVPDPVLQQVRGLREDASAHLARGLALDRDGDVAGATREHEAAVAANPDLAQAYVNLIALYGRQQQWSKAEAAYREVLRLGYGGADAHHNYGVALLMQGRLDEAASALQKAVAANPQHASAWNNLGQLAERAGRREDALIDYQHAVDAGPTDPVSRFNLGRMLIASGRPRDAVPHFELLAERDAPDPRHVYGLATAWVLSGDLAKGRRYAVQARELAVARGLTEMVAAIDRDLARLPQ